MTNPVTNPEILATHQFGDTTALYVRDLRTQVVGLELFPTALADSRVPRRADLSAEPEIILLPETAPRAWEVDPLVHIKLVGDPYPGAFAQGHTLRGSPSNATFRFQNQEVMTEGGRKTVLTILVATSGLVLEHRLSWYAGDYAAEITTRIVNGSDYPITLEMLTSFSLGNITPFHPADAPHRLRVHRFRSVWSAEGRLESRTLEELHLERSWSSAGAFSERFGQRGTMPVRGWFPFVAVEDTEAQVLWGAQLAWAGSWQMEIFRQHDPVGISGGLADREFGHWTKTLAPGEALTAPPATAACVHGDVDELCDRLTAVQQRAANAQPSIEQELPIVFNEWCTTWGDPSHAKLTALAERLRGSDTRYLVIDAGWYKGEVGDWGNAHGDWIPSMKLFPEGLTAAAASIRAAGLTPGLWFEMETVGETSTAFSLTDLLLKRDGIPVTVRSRRFWDLNDTRAVTYLSERVIDLLEQGGFGYLKVDYNETLGIGCDGAESLGEGLRRQVEGSYRFFDRIRERLPDLVIENCSSGGHRLEPSMIGRTAMSSFSDAHELREIPIIAANLHRLMLPRQSQIWSVLHPADDDRRLIYSLAAAFLGRMCLSGDIDGLSPSQWALVSEAQRLYRQAVPVIKSGSSRRYGEVGASWRHPTGWQAVVRIEEPNRTKALVVLHSFGDAPPRARIPLPGGIAQWRISGQFGESSSPVVFSPVGTELVWASPADFSGQIILLER